MQIAELKILGGWKSDCSKLYYSDHLLQAKVNTRLQKQTSSTLQVCEQKEPEAKRERKKLVSTHEKQSKTVKETNQGKKRKETVQKKKGKANLAVESSKSVNEGQKRYNLRKRTRRNAVPAKFRE